MLDSILNDGAYLIVSRVAGQDELLRRTHALLADGVESLEGAAARRLIDRRGLRCLHEALRADQIGALRDLVMPQIRPDLLALACRIGRDVLRIDGEFFVDDYTILRVNYPYLVARNASPKAENPGIGRVTERTRRESRDSQVVDPVYDPKGYHNHEPPPAWAHGPHQDTWTGHSRFGVNLWWAVDDVAEESAMVFYPETFGRHFTVDPRSLYLQAGQPLPKPTKMALRRGEMLIFNPEMLHGTHLNTTGFTRLALSTRLNPRQPQFNPDCFYAREFWHSSSDIAAGRYDDVIRFRRADNLATRADAPPAGQRSDPAVVIVAPPCTSGEWQPVCPLAGVDRGEKIVVRSTGQDDVLVMRGDETLHAVQATCPHLEISLADGFHDDEAIWCPAHAVRFSLTTGRSSCAALSVRTVDVREMAGMIQLRRG